MSRVAVVNTKTYVVENIIMASVNDPPHDGTYFVALYPDEAIQIGMLHDPVAKTFELSPEQIKELEDKWGANLASLQVEAWSTSSQ